MRSIRRRCDVNHTRGGIPEPHSSHTTARRDDSSAKRALRALLAVPPTTRCPLLCSTSASHDDGRSTDCAPAPAVYISAATSAGLHHRTALGPRMRKHLKMEKSEDLIKDATPVLAPSPASTSNQQAELAAISVQSRLLPFWREIPRAWFLQFEAVVDPLKTSDDQKFRYALPTTAARKYATIKQRLLTVYEKSEVKNFQQLIRGLELGDQKPSQHLRKMRELSNGLITEEGLRIEWLDHLPAQLRVVLSVNSESSLDTLAAMADKMLEYSEPTTIAAVQNSHTTYTPNTADVTVSAQLCVLSKQLEKLSLEGKALRIPVLQEEENVGKLEPTPTVAEVGVASGSNRLCVFDRNTRERFLVDTGADISVLAATNKKTQVNSAYKLYAANDTPINTYGERTPRLDLGLRRCFQWTFIVADVKTSILGADFLRNFKLLVDLHKKKLVDRITELAVDTIEVRTSEESIYVISPDQVYHSILTKFPDILRPMSLKAPAKHDVIHHIETTGPPVYAKPRPLPPDKYKVAKEEFERMIEMGICKPSKSPWASPLHIVKKKDGGLRVCGDYRRLNSVTLPDRYPIPRIQDFTYQLNKSRVFSKLDLKMAYYWIPLSKEDAEKTAITTPFGLFEFNCMTFGLRNASQTFQRFMHEVLRGTEGCFCFVDDILLHSEDEEQHRALLERVLERLDKYGVTLNVNKCEFGQEKLNFLGYEVSAEGIRPTEERIKAISTFPKPKTVVELRRFLGILNFYRECLPRQAEQQSALNKHLHNRKKNDKTPIEWTPESDSAFEKCRQSILEATTLSYPVHGSSLGLMTDASDLSLGAVLQQRVNGVWRPLAFFSKAMSETQRRYSVYDRELLAMYTAVKHFRRLIEGCDVTIYTDHKPLTYAMSRPASSSDTPRRERQLHFVSQFCTKIEYVKGEDNAVADSLSRIEEIACPSAIDYNKLAADQSSDEELRKIRSQSNLMFTDVALPGLSHTITCETSTATPRPYLPPAYRGAAFKAQHDLCHPGIRATKKQMAAKFFWPSMNKDVGEWTRTCISCQRAKVHRHVVTPLGEFPPSARFEHVHIDIVGPLQPSNGYRYCVTMIDRCTSWPEAVPVSEITAEAVAKAFYENWLVRFGMPIRCTTDQGRQFESSLFSALMKRFGINKIHTTAFHPQANGKVERWHRTFKAALMARGATVTWSDELPTVLLGLRTAIRENALCPAQMTYGATLRVPSDFFVPTQSKIEDADYVRRLTDTMAAISPVQKARATRERPFVYKDLRTCSHVFVRNDTVRKPLTPPYDGPYEVLERSEKFYKLRLPLRTAVISLDRLKPAYISKEADESAAVPTTASTSYTTRRCDVNHTRGGIPEPHSSHTTARRDDSSAKRALRALLAVPPTTRCPLLCSTSASHDDGRSTDCAPAPAVYISAATRAGLHHRTALGPRMRSS
ncbi:unnamed protein product [Plutella xylostella]|uniref:RNA-directed DNA polymerase n=1 Tax=Plutella xylostella TaxID=51655 RepID=A0A8S4GGW0_PLUXY|nr:unnamed protein product [Plutella xylostella]